METNGQKMSKEQFAEIVKSLTGFETFAPIVRKASDGQELYDVWDSAKLAAYSDIKIEKVIILRQADYAEFLEDLTADQKFITENRDQMFVDTSDIWHGILVIPEYKYFSEFEAGTFIESEGADYPKYAAYIDCSDYIASADDIKEG